MNENKFEFSYEVYNDISELKEKDASLLAAAREATKLAWAPYSEFHVGAAALLVNGKTVLGSNQENASYPVGTCAERVLLGNAATLYHDIPIETMAISYESVSTKEDRIKSDHPISPCGMCRQALLEYETRLKAPIRLILAGMEGPIQIIKTAKLLLPFAFTSDELK